MKEGYKKNIKFVSLLGFLGMTFLTGPKFANAQYFIQDTIRAGYDYTINKTVNTTRSLNLSLPDLVILDCEIVSENWGQNPFEVRVLVKNIGTAASLFTRIRPNGGELIDPSTGMPLWRFATWDDLLLDHQYVSALNPGQESWEYLGQITLSNVIEEWDVSILFEVDYERLVFEKNETNNIFDCGYYHQP